MQNKFDHLTKRQLAEMAVEGDQQAMLELEMRNQEEHMANAKAKAAKKATSEATIQRQVMQACMAAGWMVVRVNSSVSRTEGDRYLRAYLIGNTGASAGHADLVAYRDRYAVFLEVKTTTGRQSESQKRFAELCERHSMPYFIVRSPQEAVKVLEAVLTYPNK